LKGWAVFYFNSRKEFFTMGTRPEDVEPVPPETLDEQTLTQPGENLSEPPEPAVAAPAQPAAPAQTPPPALDEAALEERLLQRVTGKISPQLEEHYKRLAESNRSRYANLRTQYQALVKQVNDLEAAGKLTHEDAMERKITLRDEHDAAVMAADQSAEAAQLQQEQQRLLALQKGQQDFNAYCRKVLLDLEFATTDPEVKDLMGKQFGTGDDLEDAKAAFQREALKAARKKDKRVAGELSNQALQTQQQRQAAQARAVPSFVGGSAGTKPPTLETMDARLEQLLNNPVLKDRNPKGYAAWQKEVDALRASIQKAMTP
jgi:hypothetical protein